MKNTDFVKKLLLLLLALVTVFSFVACGGTGDGDGEGEGTKPECQHIFMDGVCPFCGKNEEITVAAALELCGEPGNITEQRYYIRATVKTITNPAYGAMIIYDETGEISVYGTYSADGELPFAEIAETPKKGDEVLLACILQNYDGDKEVKNARLIEWKKNETPFDATAYTAATIAEAREADEGAKLKVSGVVARITYANGYIPSGVILVDETSSIYVYDGDVAGQVSIGNTVELAGTKAYWILGTEADNAAKFGYKGSCQLDEVTLISNDKGNSAFDKSWITETTVKEIIDTPVTENITNKIYKVNALITRADGNGFINYYIDDLDGATGTYTYTQCSGGDFAWLDAFDGKICTVYVVAINAKSTTTGCTWRFLPVEVIDEGYTFDTKGTAEHVVKYYGVDRFLAKYTGDPALEVVTKVSSELLGFTDATITYSSSNTAVVSFVTEDGKLVMHCGDEGTATVTVSSTYEGETYSETVTIEVAANLDVEYITVAEAIATPYDTDVVVRGIVGPSLVNQQGGFYLFGEDGSMVAVKLSDASKIAEIAIGHEIVLTGMRERYIKDDSYTTYGQDAIVNGVVIANYYGEHEYSTEKFITGKTLADIKALDVTESHSTEVYVVTVSVTFIETDFYTSLKIEQDGVEFPLYCSSAKQYNWLKDFDGQEITVEIAPCNWNDKKDNYRGCVLAVVTEDGKIYNTLNFGN